MCIRDRTKAAKKSSRMEEKKADTIPYQTEDMADFDEAEITEDTAAEAAPVKKKKASAKSGRKSVSDKSGTGKTDRKKSGQLKSVSSKSATGKKKKSSGKRTSSSRKHRRRRKNWKPAVIAASLSVVVLGGGGFGLHALGIIGGREPVSYTHLARRTGAEWASVQLPFPDRLPDPGT